MTDMVNHPPHYTQGDVECIDAIKASMDRESYCGFLKGQVIKYLWRYEKKWNQKEDVEKAMFYLDKLHEAVSNDPQQMDMETAEAMTTKLKNADKVWL